MAPLHGRFGDTSGRPYMEGRLLIPRLNHSLDISFLVDTGADRSMLMPADAARVNLDYNVLQEGEEIFGVSGQVATFQEMAVVVFSEPEVRLHLYQIDLLIAPPSPDLMKTPSLLGRDVLDQWQIHLCASRKEIEFTPMTADATMDLPLSLRPPTWDNDSPPAPSESD